MKAILFCINPYAFGIMKPLHDELIKFGHQVLWYIPDRIKGNCPFLSDVEFTNSIAELYKFKSDAIFVPGNEVPHYLHGVKVQIFHGLAGEKKGHFRIRNYFDLYLTQGPYFTNRFRQLASSHGDFDVVETGWCKLDTLFSNHESYLLERSSLLESSGKKTLVLYAPTFSPSLTCSVEAKDKIFEIADSEDVFILIKFHDLMNAQVAEEYRQLASTRSNVKVVDDRNILKYLVMCDIMISDTSSVVYEFVLLNKPVVTVNSKSANINWRDISSSDLLHDALMEEIEKDNYKDIRRDTIEQYHPYSDGKSSARMIAAVEDYIEKNGIPARRKMNIYRRYLMNKMFGSEPKS
ncbi:MAG: CDP-glycerol glycerophosphotransferase family protein [Bacteroidales bacterium]